MALQQIRIGNAVDIYQYDDAVVPFDSGIACTAPISAASPVNADECLILGDVGTIVGDVSGPGASTDHAVVRWDGVGGVDVQDSSLIVLDDGSLGIGTVPSHHIHSVNADATVATAHGFLLDHSFSGNHPGGGDIIQYGISLDVTSTVIGTQVAGNRQSVYGLDIVSNIDASGQSYLNCGLSSRAYHNHTTALTYLQGGRFGARNESSATVTYSRGVNIECLNLSTGVLTYAHGIRSMVTNSGAGSIGTAYGFYTAVTQSAGTLTTGYLLYGAFTGTVGTKWGIYLTGETLNYLSGRLGINITAPTAQLHVDQSDTGGAIPVLSLDQADISDGFINFIGSDRGVITGATDSLESVRVEINGTVRRLALYVDA